jgi:hypothetical protein
MSFIVYRLITTPAVPLPPARAVASAKSEGEAVPPPPSSCAFIAAACALLVSLGDELE